jgi:hypothetical protein
MTCCELVARPRSCTQPLIEPLYCLDTHWLAAALNPEKLNFKVHTAWVSTEMKRKAKVYLDTAQHSMLKQIVDGDEVWYLLSQSQTVFKKISATLVAKYEQARRGEVPRGTGGKWEAVADICLSMYKVHEGSPKASLECDLNPFLLVCGKCKAFAHDGICKHVLAVTHEMMGALPIESRSSENNLKYMLKSIGKRRKKTSGRPQRVTPALVPSRHLENEDSSDEEEEAMRRIEDGEAW